MANEYGFSPVVENKPNEYGFSSVKTEKSNPFKDVLYNLFGGKILEGLPTALPILGKDIQKLGTAAIEGAPEAAKESYYNPTGSIKNVGAGILEGLIGMGNIPHNLPKTFAHYGYLEPEEAEKISEKLPVPEFHMPKVLEDYFGEPETKGQSWLRGLGELLIPGGGAIKGLKPLSIEQKVGKVLKARDKNINYYSPRYEKLFNKAEKEGYGETHFNPKNIDFDTIKKHTPNPEEALKNLQEFLVTPNANVRLAQKAVQELGQLERSSKFEKFPAEEHIGEALKKVKQAKSEIEQGMFRNKEGKVNENFLKQHNTLQTGWAKDVAPYYLSALNQYEKGELTVEKTLEKLKNYEKFEAKKGRVEHPYLYESGLSKFIKEHPIASTVVGGATGALGIQPLMNLLLGKSSKNEP